MRQRVLQTVLFAVFGFVYLYHAIQLFAFTKASVITSLLFFLTVGGLARTAIKSVGKRLGLSGGTQVNMGLLLGSVFLSISGADLALRYGYSRYASYAENNGSFFYISPYPTALSLKMRARWAGTSGRLLIAPRKLAFLRHSREFSNPFSINSEGIRDVEHPKPKPSGELRIIALGDSFTEGIGANFEMTWLQQLQGLLKAREHAPLRVISGGVTGSDPFYAYTLLHDRLLDYHPDLVLVAINASDLDDYLVRGGMERFQEDGRVRYHPGPPWEWIYASSYLFRHLIHDGLGYDRLFLRPAERAVRVQQANVALYNVCQSFMELGQTHGFKLLFIFHPLQHEVLSKRLEFADLLSKLKHDAKLETFDLLEYYTTVERMNQRNITAYYWPIDQHHTPKGYAAFAAGVAHHLVQLGWLPGSLESPGPA